MKYNKPAVSFSDQVKKLKRRGLLFRDEHKAEQILSRISYYRLRAYTYPFQDNSNPEHPFKIKIYFETIIDLYKFDSQLRLLIFDALEKIEIALRTQIIYQWAMTNGSHWQTNIRLFRDQERFYEHKKSLEKEISRSDETFIKHYKKKYTEPPQPPAWISLEVASFGTLSKLYQNLINGEEKKAVAKSFKLPNPLFLENWMLCFSNLRNICAHHGRLWNRRLVAIPKLPYNVNGIFLTKKEIETIYPNKIYGNLCIINYMLSEINSANNFRQKLVRLMDNCPLDQEKEMGFLEGWREHPLWNINIK